MAVVPLRALPNIQDPARPARAELVDELVDPHRRERARRPARRGPRIDAAAEVSEDRVPADATQLHARLLERLVVRDRQDQRRRERHQPAHVRRERRLERDVQGPGDVALGERVAVANIHQPGSRSERVRHFVDGHRPRNRWRTEHRRSGPVDRRHRRVVRGERHQAGQLASHEGFLVGLVERRVAVPLLGDRRGPPLAGRSDGAEAAGPVGGEHPDGVGQLGEPSHRTELQPRELVGAPGAEQVGAARTADHEAAAREQRDRFRPIALDVGEMLWGMAGRRDAEQGGVAQRDLGAALDRSVPERVPGLRRSPDLGARRRSQFERAREVVVVDVGLHDVADRGSSGARRVDEPLDVALRVDDRRLVAPAQDVARVAEPLGDHDVELHRPHPMPGTDRWPIRVRCLNVPTPIGTSGAAEPGGSCPPATFLSLTSP